MTYSKIHVTVALAIITLAAVVCSTILALNDKDIGVLGYAITAAVGAIGGLAVPSITAPPPPVDPNPDL